MKWNREADDDDDADADDIQRRASKVGPENNGSNEGDFNGKKLKTENCDADDGKGNGDSHVCHCDCDADGDDGDESDDGGDSVSNAAIEVDSDVDFVFDLRKAQLSTAKFLCSVGKPYLAEDVIFGKFMKSMNPHFSVDYDLFKSDCLQIYEEEKSRVKHILNGLDGQICLSVDVFTCWKGESNDDFMCLVAHFIDDRWKLKKWVLNFWRIWDDNCDSLDQAILKSLKDWEIEGKIFSLTKADAQDDDELVQIVKGLVQEKKRLQIGGKLFGVNCCARMFSLMVEDAYKEISDIISKVWWLISWKFSPLWYMTMFQLKHALALESIGEFSSQDVQDKYDVPSEDEWEKVKCVCKLVESAYDVAKSLFETKYPTANMFLHKLQELRAILSHESLSLDSFRSNVAKKMLQRLDIYWNQMYLLLAISSVMDPRCKMVYIEFLSSKCDKSDDKLQTAVVSDAIRSLYDDYVKRDLEREQSEVDSTSSNSEEELPRTVGEGLMTSKWLQEYSQFVGSINQLPKPDLDRYLEEPVLPWRENFNVLSWWRAESSKYPILAKMARDILAIPMSVATSTEAYNTGPREADPRIVTSGPDALRNAMMCTRSWAKGR